VVARRDNTLRIPNAALRVRMPEGIAVVHPPAAGTGAKGAAGGASPSAASGGGRRRSFFGADATPEQRQKMREIMAEIGFTRGSGPPTPEQREQMHKLMVARGLIPADQAGAGGGGGSEPAYTTRTVYRLPAGNHAAPPEAVSVRVGITDGLMSEIAGGLSEGDVVITSASLPGASRGAPTNPFGGRRRF
jgi:HlyD family secretion protein